MSETSPVFTRPARAPQPEWAIAVAEIVDLTPHMRRIVFTGALAGFQHLPGQDLVLLMDTGGDELGRRHYTIRDFRDGRLSIDFVLHGHDGPAERWALTAKPGDRLQARGPRGRTVIRPDADWHVFVGDETCLPGIAAMIESLPDQALATAFIEVAEEADRQEIAAVCRLDLNWLVRRGPAVPASPRLIERLSLFAPPPGRGQAYVIGETSTVQAQRRGLLARGLGKDQISAEGYWRPGRLGGHDHIFDMDGAGMRGR